MGIKALPAEQRPRERLLRDGVEALNLSELLAIILGSGTAKKSVLALSQEILEAFGSLDALIDASITELMQIKGIGRAKAIQLKAIFGIARQCRRTLTAESEKIDSAEKAYALARPEIAECNHEVLFVILRDVRSRLIHCEKISVGTLTQVLVHPREVFYPAIRHKAHSMILVHNHPSGDPTASKADLEMTRHLSYASRIMGIPLIDHLIISAHQFVSLRALGFVSGNSY